MHVKIKSNGKFYYYGGCGSVRNTTDEAECLWYDMTNKDDFCVIREILSYLFMVNQEATLVPVSKTGERLSKKKCNTVETMDAAHGRWVDGLCSQCGYPIPTDSRCDYIDEDECCFCYHCGAKMDACYAIAFTDNENKDSNGMPWKEIGFRTFEEAEQHRQLHFKDCAKSIVFMCPKDAEDIGLQISWEYVMAHAVEHR